MPLRVRFDAALRNALKVQKSRPEGHEDTTTAVMPPVEGGEDTTTAVMPPVEGGEDTTTAVMPPVEGGEDTTTAVMPPVEGGEDTTTAVISPESAGEPRQAGRLKKIFYERAVQVRHFLVGNLQYNISEFQGWLLRMQLQLDERLTRVEGRFEPMETRLEARFAPLEARLEARFAPLEARLEARFALLEARLEPRFATLEAKFALLDIMPSQLENLSLKVRPVLVIDESTVAVRVADGYAIVSRRDALLLVMLADSPSGALEPGTRSVMLRLLEAGMTVVDVGAHIGLHTLAVARKVGPDGCVYAFEPAPATFEMLKRTITLNALTEVVRPKMLAIGAGAERRTLYLHSTSGHNSFYATSGVDAEEPQSIEVEVDTLDSVVPLSQNIDLVKIDVEGAELDVLAGMGRIIADNRDLVIIAEFGPSHLERVGIDAQEWFRRFEELGFVALAIEELSGRCLPVRYNEVAEMISLNIAFVRPHQASRLSPQ